MVENIYRVCSKLHRVIAIAMQQQIQSTDGRNRKGTKERSQGDGVLCLKEASSVRQHWMDVLLPMFSSITTGTPARRTTRPLQQARRSAGPLCRPMTIAAPSPPDRRLRAERCERSSSAKFLQLTFRASNLQQGSFAQ